LVVLMLLVVERLEVPVPVLIRWVMPELQDAAEQLLLRLGGGGGGGGGEERLLLRLLRALRHCFLAVRLQWM